MDLITSGWQHHHSLCQKQKNEATTIEIFIPFKKHLPPMQIILIVTINVISGKDNDDDVATNGAGVSKSSEEITS